MLRRLINCRIIIIIIIIIRIQYGVYLKSGYLLATVLCLERSLVNLPMTMPCISGDRLRLYFYNFHWSVWNLEVILFGSLPDNFVFMHLVIWFSDIKHTCSRNPYHHPLLPAGLPTGLQPDCLHRHGLRTAQRFVIVFPLSSFSSRVYMTKLVHSQFLITR